MARKTTKTETKRTSNKNPQPKRAIDDNYVAPKRKPKAERTVTLAEALAESGETMDELRAPETPPAAERPTREAGMSNLATTIRAHRRNYQVALHPNGKKTQNNGDIVAQVLLFVTLDELKQFSGERFEGRRYDQLNPGHARMCIGNLIRGALNKNDEAVMGWVASIQKRIAEQAAAE